MDFPKGGQLEHMSPNVFPNLKRTLEYSLPPHIITTLFLWEHMIIGGFPPSITP